MAKETKDRSKKNNKKKEEKNEKRREKSIKLKDINEEEKEENKEKIEEKEVKKEKKEKKSKEKNEVSKENNNKEEKKEEEKNEEKSNEENNNEKELKEEIEEKEKKEEKKEEKNEENEEKKEEDDEKNIKKKDSTPSLQRSNSQPIPKMDQDELIALAGADPAKLVELLRKRQTVERRFIPVGNNSVGSHQSERITKISQNEKEMAKNEENNNEKDKKIRFGNEDEKSKSKIIIVEENFKLENNNINIEIKSDLLDSLKKLVLHSQPKSDLNLNYNDYSKALLQISDQIEEILKFTKNGLEKCIKYQKEKNDFFNDEIFSQIDHKTEKINAYFSVSMKEKGKGGIGGGGVFFAPPPPPPNLPPPPPPPMMMNSSPLPRINRSTSSGALTGMSVRKKGEIDPNAEVVNAIKGGVKLRSVAPKTENKDNNNNNDTNSPFTLRKTNFEEKKVEKGDKQEGNIFGVRLRNVPKEEFTFSTEKKNEENNKEEEEVAVKEESHTLPSTISKSKASRPTSWGPVSNSLIKKSIDQFKDDLSDNKKNDNKNDAENEEKKVEVKNEDEKQSTEETKKETKEEVEVKEVVNEVVKEETKEEVKEETKEEKEENEVKKSEG